LQIQNLIIDLQKKKRLENIINIGAGDGYHIISLVKNNFFKRGIAFEINSENKLILQKNLIINKIKKKVITLSEGKFSTIKEIVLKSKINLNKTLFLIDIEGGEFNLFDLNNIKYFKKSFLIIEDHSMIAKNKFLIIKKFFNLIYKNFDVKIINNMNRDPYTIDKLKDFSDDERWLMMTEARGMQMRWILLSPK
jgi:tRNA G37 N-methylase Trm5